MSTAHLNSDHPQGEHIRRIRRQTRVHSIVGSDEFRCHPSVGSLEPNRRSLRAVQTGDPGKPKVVESRTTRLVNENIILKWEMVSHYQLRPSIGERNRAVPLSNPHARSRGSVRTINRD